VAQMRSVDRRHLERRPASATVSKLIVTGFTVAALAGFLAGLGWLAYTFISRVAGG